MSLHQLIYMSELITDESVLNSIHSHAVRNNTVRTVTGMLIFAGGRFLQVLEGEGKDVQHVFERIKDDPRHDHVILLADCTIAERSFSHWNMGFKHLKAEELESFPEYQQFFRQDLAQVKDQSALALQILKHFV